MLTLFPPDACLSFPPPDPVLTPFLNPPRIFKTWRTSSSLSITTTPTRPRTTSTASAARPAAPTKAPPTPSSLRATAVKPASWSGSWRRPGRPSIPNCCSLPTTGAEEVEEVFGGWLGIYASSHVTEPPSKPPLCPPGGRPRFRGGSGSNNPNLMYQDECDRRMRSVGVGGGAGSTKDSSGSYGRDSRTGSSRESERSSSSSSYRDRREGGRSFGSGSTSYSQYQNNSNSCQYSGARVGSGAGVGGGGEGGQAPPPAPPPAPQPLMAQQFNPPQTIMGLMGHTPFQFAPATGRKWRNNTHAQHNSAVSITISEEIQI